MKTKLSILLITMFLLAACSPSSAPAPAATSAAPLSGMVDVTISGFAYHPADLTIKVGSTVTWTNQDSVAHNVTANDNSWGSPDLNKGDSFSYTFDAAGTYAYHCTFHSNMNATITVVP